MAGERSLRSREQPPETVHSIDQYPSEDAAPAATLSIAWIGLQNRRAIGAILLGLAVLGALMLLWIRSTVARAESITGSLRVMSEPDPAAVFIDGNATGTTPVSLRLRRGVHRLLVRQGDRSQEVPVTVDENGSAVHHFTWSVEPSKVISTGSIRVMTDGDTASVTIDARPRGSTPLTVSNLVAGNHDVVMVRNGTSYQQKIQVYAGAVASLVLVTGPAAGPRSGWVSVSSAIPLEIREGGKLVGSTASERILMPAGEHTLEFGDVSLGFRVARKVNIVAGQTQKVDLQLPQSLISINAIPWAQAWLDGQPLGETPIGNVTTSIGSHEVLLRHPQLGERRLTAVVTTKEPARVAVDMRRSQ